MTATRVLDPWTPLETHDAEGRRTVNVWGRSYGFGAAALPIRITSAATSLLAGPVRLVGQEDGTPIAWAESGNFFLEKEPDRAVLHGWQQSELLVLNTATTIEFDGSMKIDLKIMPRGMTVPQVMGLEEPNRRPRNLEALWLEIPLRTEIAGLYHAWPTGGITSGDAVGVQLRESGAIPAGGMSMTYKPLMWFGNEDVGLCLYSESDQFWQPADSARAIELRRNGDTTIVRLRLLDSRPASWSNETGHGINNPPVAFTLSLQATPVKPFNEDFINLNVVHIDCFRKIEGDYNPFLKSPVNGADGETVLEKLTRCGVNVLVLHEKWIDIQNYWRTNEAKEKDIAEIVSLCHARGIRVLPYFGYELSSAAPEWNEYAETVLNKTVDGRKTGGWYRVPPQRAHVVCYNSEWRRHWLDGVKAAVERFDFDGVYLDSTVRAMACANEAHGCGYRTASGDLKPTYPFYAVRDLFKELYTCVHGRGGIVNPHPFNCFCVPAFTFADMYWDGEQVQFPLVKGETDSLSLDYFRAEYIGRNIGVPCQFIVYENRPLWTFEKALSLSVVHGIYPRPNDVASPLDIMAPIWKAIRDFGVSEAEWHPYWETAAPIATADRSAIVISYYRRQSGNGKTDILLLVSNPHKEAAGRITLRLEPQLAAMVSQVVDALTGECLPVKAGALALEFGEFQLRMLRIQ